MKKRTIVSVLLFVSTLSGVHAVAQPPAPSHGIRYPSGWQDWSAIAVSHRRDNNTLRVILGNEIAVNAARSGQTNPWPDGAVIGKVVWNDTALEAWETATVPGNFVHAEFMFKDSGKYAESCGWGWARWVGIAQEPFNQGPQTCISCHTPVQDHDWVFTRPAAFPKGK